MPRNSYRVRFAGGTGYELVGIVDRPADTALAVAVFSHCFTCNKDLKAIVRISRGLADAGIAVLRFDMTGLGGSDGDFSFTNFTSNVADLKTAIGFANQELGTVTALIGHSFGGAASLHVAAEQDSLGAVVALAAPSDTQHLAELLAKLNPEIESAGVGEVNIGGYAWTIRREMLADFRQHDLPGRIPIISCPTLLFHSPIDQTVGFDHAIRIMGLLQNSPTQAAPVSIVSLEGADHLLANSAADVDFVIATAAAFIKRYSRRFN